MEICKCLKNTWSQNIFLASKNGFKFEWGDFLYILHVKTYFVAKSVIIRVPLIWRKWQIATELVENWDNKPKQERTYIGYSLPIFKPPTQLGYESRQAPYSLQSPNFFLLFYRFSIKFSLGKMKNNVKENVEKVSKINFVSA